MVSTSNFPCANVSIFFLDMISGQHCKTSISDLNLNQSWVLSANYISLVPSILRMLPDG